MQSALRPPPPCCTSTRRSLRASAASTSLSAPVNQPRDRRGSSSSGGGSDTDRSAAAATSGNVGTQLLPWFQRPDAKPTAPIVLDKPGQTNKQPILSFAGGGCVGAGRGPHDAPGRQPLQLRMRMRHPFACCLPHPPACSIFFWWELGVLKYLHRHFDLTGVQLVGASAGGLVATLAACGVSEDRAVSAAAEKQSWVQREQGAVGAQGECRPRAAGAPPIRCTRGLSSAPCRPPPRAPAPPDLPPPAGACGAPPRRGAGRLLAPLGPRRRLGHAGARVAGGAAAAGRGRALQRAGAAGGHRGALAAPSLP